MLINGEGQMLKKKKKTQPSPRDTSSLPASLSAQGKGFQTLIKILVNKIRAQENTSMCFIIIHN